MVREMYFMLSIGYKIVYVSRYDNMKNVNPLDFMPNPKNPSSL
jgi:hypothetical protein